MLKRLRWFTLGAATGLGASWWAKRTVQRTAERYTPGRVVGDVRDAVRAGVADMRRTEQQLRRELAAGGPPGGEPPVLDVPSVEVVHLPTRPARRSPPPRPAGRRRHR